MEAKVRVVSDFTYTKGTTKPIRTCAMKNIRRIVSSMCIFITPNVIGVKRLHAIAALGCYRFSLSRGAA